jgi:hypothetical protein
MPDQPDRTDPAHVSGRHRDTLTQILQHPVSHNIEWRKAIALLEEVGTVVEEHDGRFKITVGGETEVLNRPHGKDLTEQQVVDLRRMLGRAGLDAKPAGKED